ncbi:hypothetical protein Q8A73_019528 [Channa argus]|nr:hypothetical protein Q8A73_019528 [Channa argus]
MPLLKEPRCKPCARGSADNSLVISRSAGEHAIVMRPFSSSTLRICPKGHLHGRQASGSKTHWLCWNGCAEMLGGATPATQLCSSVTTLLLRSQSPLAENQWVCLQREGEDRHLEQEMEGEGRGERGENVKRC